jgi:hypothetical protein
MTQFLQRRSVQLALLLTIGTGTGVFISRRTADKYRLKSTETCLVAVANNDNVQTEVLIVESGAAALTAALRLRAAGMSPLIVEKSGKVGGTSCFSGGGLWIPNTHLQAAVLRHNDSQEEAMEYLEGIIGDVDPTSSKEREVAFLENGRKMIQFLMDQGMKWKATIGYPDYFPTQPGGKTSGRTVEPGILDANLLGPWREKLNYNPVRPPFPVFCSRMNCQSSCGLRFLGREDLQLQTFFFFENGLKNYVLEKPQ